MARIPSLSRTLSTTVPLARGVADRAVSTATPVVLGVVGRLTRRLPRRSPTEPSTPETFTPAAVVAEPVVVHPVVDEVPDTSTVPSPAAVARNAAGPRPTAKAPAARKPRSAPGAKLPARRPSPST